MKYLFRRKTVKQCFYIIILTLFLFMCYINEKGGVLKYTDELTSIFVLVAGGYRILNSGGKVKKITLKLVALMLGIILIGLLGNLISNVERSKLIIVLDMFNCLKVFVTFAFAMNLKVTEDDWHNIITSVACIVQITIVIAFICGLINQVANIGMSDEIRYGIKGFKFIFLNEGTLSTACYTYIIFLTFAMPEYIKKIDRRINMVVIVLTLLIMISTLRTRAFAFAIFYVFIYYYYIMKNKSENKKNRIRMWQVILGIVSLSAVSAPTLEKYFTNTRMARYQLLHGALELSSKYFPIGTGFCTYGTYMAQQYYSPLYRQLGFNQIWGMSESMRDLLTDSCWPAVLGQFGIIGVILYSIMLSVILLYIYRIAKQNRYYYTTVLFFIVITVGASVATATFFHFMTVGQMLILGIFVSKENNSKMSSS